MNISFEDTATTFRYKTNRDLRRARLLFKLIGKRWFVKLVLRITPFALKMGL
ncbi:MAG: hypothetical protein ABI325_05875 [Ginsengibacter sp.]